MQEGGEILQTVSAGLVALKAATVGQPCLRAMT
jgi:hypothetical protein